MHVFYLIPHRLHKPVLDRKMVYHVFDAINSKTFDGINLFRYVTKGTIVMTALRSFIYVIVINSY